ncbi:DUF2723 domain-containing protein [Cyclobacteriaceae bacterium]|nr:DUF2723 domain-containing protein [Cyclobacteriaceae bacterium]
MDFKKLNNIGGWLVFLIALVVYTLTVEPTASYWDCGEFIAVSYKLQTPHPPGVPIYILIARLFSLFASDNTQIAFWVNMVSVVSSAFTILFMFWTISYIARKVLKIARTVQPSQTQAFLILSSALVGSLAFAFSDSFWFNAVEAEVYAMSMFFSAFVYWSMLKWDYVADEEGADKWLILTFYMMGLSLGVHILNLIMIPGLALIYYFRRSNADLKGAVITLAISIVGLGFILEIMYYGSATLSKHLDFWLTDMGMPVGAGFIAFLVIIVAAFTGLIVYSIKTKNYALNLSTIGAMFIMLGYLSYAEIVIRSLGNPVVDENNPENPYFLEKYLRREQYGSQKLLFGVQFGFHFQQIEDKYGLRSLSRAAREKKIESWKKPLYMVKDGKWVVYHKKQTPEYAKKWKSFLPRMTHANDRNMAVYESKLKSYGNYDKGDYKKKGWKPSFGENVQYMLDRQLGTMYFRYFGWNFIGRDGDLQFSKVRYPWDTDEKPINIDSKAVNNFYAIPLILGLFGVVFLFGSSPEDFWTSAILFVFGGIAIVVYLNAPAVEPRERDYAYAGSYYIFAIWIGMGVLAIASALKEAIKEPKAAIAIALVVGLIAPGIMAAEGWDDHDRSDRLYSVEGAINMLESCEENAILFTEGDNDTFPLWFVQEVLEIRQDVRVCNTSLLGTQWYVEQMTRKAYDSEALPIKFKKEQYQEGVNDVAYYNPADKSKEDNLISLQGYMDLLRKESSAVVQNGTSIYPSKRFKIKLDNKEQIIANGNVPEKFQSYFLQPHYSELRFEIEPNHLTKDQIMTLELISEISKAGWDRPIYFGSPRHPSALGLGNCLLEVGLIYKLVPFPLGIKPDITHAVDIDKMYHNLMTNDALKWSNLGDKSIHYSDQHVAFASNSREKFSSLANALLIDTSVEDHKQKAKDVVYRCLDLIPDGPIYYSYSNMNMAFTLYKAGDKEKALEILAVMAERAVDVAKYENTYGKEKPQYNYTFRINRAIKAGIGKFYFENGLEQEAADLGYTKNQLKR